jgi:hypothetical protein
MPDSRVVFYDVAVQKTVSRKGKRGRMKKVQVVKEEIHVGIVGTVVGDDQIWWAEHVHQQQRSGKYDMLLVHGSSKPLVDPRPAFGLLMELPVQCVVEEEVPKETFSLIEIKITQDQWDAAKAISLGQCLFFVSFFLILINLMFVCRDLVS